MNKPINKSELKDAFELHFTELSEKLQAAQNGTNLTFRFVAVPIRALVYTKDDSPSLLTQIGVQNEINYFASGQKHTDRTIPPFMAFGGFTVTLTGEGALAKVSSGDDSLMTITGRFESFDDWWNDIILVNSNGDTWTRKEIVLTFANNKVAHTSKPNIKNTWLHSNPTMNWEFSDGAGLKAIDGSLAVAALFVIAKELHRTLRYWTATYDWPVLNS